MSVEPLLLLPMVVHLLPGARLLMGGLAHLAAVRLLVWVGSPLCVAPLLLLLMVVELGS